MGGGRAPVHGGDKPCSSHGALLPYKDTTSHQAQQALGRWDKDSLQWTCKMSNTRSALCWGAQLRAQCSSCGLVRAEQRAG